MNKLEVNCLNSVVDILITLCDNNINAFRTCFNNYYPKKKFTLESESNNKINFLDMTLIKIDEEFPQIGVKSLLPVTDSLSSILNILINKIYQSFTT